MGNLKELELLVNNSLASRDEQKLILKLVGQILDEHNIKYQKNVEEVKVATKQLTDSVTETVAESKKAADVALGEVEKLKHELALANRELKGIKIAFTSKGAKNEQSKANS